MDNKCKIQHRSIPNFIPSEALARAAAESFNTDIDWVRYGGAEDNQVRWRYDANTKCKR